MDHLYQTQKDDILKVLQKHSSKFYGTPGVYPHKSFHIDVDPDENPVYSQPYPVPHIHLSNFKNELENLVRLGVLVHQKESKWASPTFIVPKKDGRVLWISNLCQSNKVIKRKQYHLSVITEIL